jgi:hypothetical protein
VSRERGAQTAHAMCAVVLPVLALISDRATVPVSSSAEMIKLSYSYDTRNEIIDIAATALQMRACSLMQSRSVARRDVPE